MKALSSASGISTETIRFLGLTLQPRSLQQMTLLVEEGIRERRNWIIANHNLHSVYLCHRYPKLRDFYSQVSWTHCDGMSLVALGRLYGYPLQREHRVTLADWIYPLMELAAVGVFSIWDRRIALRKRGRHSYASSTRPFK